MKSIKSIIIFVVAIGIYSCTKAQKQKSGNMGVNNNLIFPQGEKITNKNFTGTAYLKMLVEADSVNPTAIGNVTFEAGARTKSKKILRKGDVVKCPPNVPHWHGASADSGFIQVAVTNNQKGATVWLEEVTDKEYNAAYHQ
jgi:hypothetical protein